MQFLIWCYAAGFNFKSAYYVMKYFLFLLFLLSYLFAQHEIEGRWHLVGYEDAIMYQFVDTEPFADAGLRYSIYVDENGEFDDLDGDNIGGTPHPYSVVGDIITIDTHFGNILSYQMNYKCDGQVVDFVYIPEDIIHSTLYREGFDYSSSECQENECEEGYVEINDLCFHEGDISIIQMMIDNSYQSGIDLDCNGSPYCGSPNPYHDAEDFWGWLAYDGISYELLRNGNGIVEPIELGIQQWENGRLKSLDCGVYIYCQLSGSIPEEINQLTELEHFRVEGNYLSGHIPESICQLDMDYDNHLNFDVSYNRFCPPFPDCIDTDYEFWGQFDEYCSEFGDINNDLQINILDVVLLVGFILMTDEPTDAEFLSADINFDASLSILDIVAIIQIILDADILSEDCYIIPEIGACDGICFTYFYNHDTNQCEEFITGCCGIEAFNTLQECQNTCE